MGIQAVNNSHFDALITNVQQTKNRAGSSAAALVIFQDQETVTEWYDGYHHHKKGAQAVTARSLFNVYSVRKTYTVAVDEYRVGSATKREFSL